jgi:hypothetical protein
MTTAFRKRLPGLRIRINACTDPRNRLAGPLCTNDICTLSHFFGVLKFAPSGNHPHILIVFVPRIPAAVVFSDTNADYMDEIWAYEFSVSGGTPAFDTDANDCCISTTAAILLRRKHLRVLTNLRNSFPM